LSKKSKGETSMKHARAWVESRHSGAQLLEAGARLSRFPDKNRPGEWITHTTTEDLFGVFDIGVFPTDGSNLIELIQVTTMSLGSRSAVASRKTKVGSWVRTHLNSRPAWLAGIYVVAWVPRTHLRIWAWDWSPLELSRQSLEGEPRGRWVELPADPAKLPKMVRKTRAQPGRASAEQNPFD
tara:strand:- start:1864 stop:2409 length:546 start_codon:yes stop_codon:yes gene_type:complete